MGDAYNLPVNPNVTEAELIQHALTMPAVATAMNEFAARGYVRRADHDHAEFVIAGAMPVAIVGIQFTKPGLITGTLGPNTVAAPVIMIGTLVDYFGTAATQVSSGVLVADLNPDAQPLKTAEAYPQIASTDPSFDTQVDPSASGEGGFDPPPILPDPHDAVTSGFGAKLTRWASCTGWGGLGCSIAAFRVTRSAGAIIIGLAAPEVAVAVVGGCALGSAIGCLSNFGD